MTYPYYTPAQRRDLFSWESPPENLGPEDDEENNEETMEEDGYGQDCIHFDNPADDYGSDNPADDYGSDHADDYGSDNPADDYIMTERELRGEL